MANETRSFDPTPQQANRSIDQGLGVGQREMDAQRNPSREQQATDPRRPDRFDNDDAASEGGEIDDRDAAGLGEGTELGAGTPPNVDIHKLGQDDKPEQDWGEPADEGTMHSSTHTRRGEKTEAERGQGPKTRQATKDIISRRA